MVSVSVLLSSSVAGVFFSSVDMLLCNSSRLSSTPKFVAPGVYTNKMAGTSHVIALTIVASFLQSTGVFAAVEVRVSSWLWIACARVLGVLAPSPTEQFNISPCGGDLLTTVELWFCLVCSVYLLIAIMYHRIAPSTLHAPTPTHLPSFSLSPHSPPPPPTPHPTHTTL